MADVDYDGEKRALLRVLISRVSVDRKKSSKTLRLHLLTRVELPGRTVSADP